MDAMFPKLEIPPGNIPDGTYDGHWSGCCLDFEAPIGKISAMTLEGVRGLRCPVKVTVQAGTISFVNKKRFTALRM